MNSPRVADGSIELFGEPGAVAVSGWGIEPVRIDLRRQDSEIVAAAAGFTASFLKSAPQKPVTVHGARHAASSEGGTIVIVVAS